MNWLEKTSICRHTTIIATRRKPNTSKVIRGFVALQTVNSSQCTRLTTTSRWPIVLRTRSAVPTRAEAFTHRPCSYSSVFPFQVLIDRGLTELDRPAAQPLTEMRRLIRCKALRSQAAHHHTIRYPKWVLGPILPKNLFVARKGRSIVKGVDGGDKKPHLVDNTHGVPASMKSPALKGLWRTRKVPATRLASRLPRWPPGQQCCHEILENQAAFFLSPSLKIFSVIGWPFFPTRSTPAGSIPVWLSG